MCVCACMCVYVCCRSDMGGPAARAEWLFVRRRDTATPLPHWDRLVGLGVDFWHFKSYISLLFSVGLFCSIHHMSPWTVINSWVCPSSVVTKALPWLSQHEAYSKVHIKLIRMCRQTPKQILLKVHVLFWLCECSVHHGLVVNLYWKCEN